jgi:hypothetical protein
MTVFIAKNYNIFEVGAKRVTLKEFPPSWKNARCMAGKFDILIYAHLYIPRVSFASMFLFTINLSRNIIFCSKKTLLIALQKALKKLVLSFF